MKKKKVKQKNKVKIKIYIRTFAALLAAYLVLMIGFSIFMLNQEMKVRDIQNGSTSTYISNQFEEILQENMDSNNQITDTLKLRKECLNKLASFPIPEVEIALYTGDYNLICNSNDYWLCSYTVFEEENKNDTNYAYLNPKKWFDEAVATELDNYLYAAPKAEKVGDLKGYSLELNGFWLEDEMIIPEKIVVVPMYANSFDENGVVLSSSGTWTNDKSYTFNYKNTKGLPYIKNGSIMSTNRRDEKLSELRNMVSDKEKLKESVQKLRMISYERVNLVTYRCCVIVPYQNAFEPNPTDSKSYYSKCWTVVGFQVNLLEKCINTLIFIWAGCFTVFAIAAIILSTQTYKIYKKRELLDKYRSETTNALAHDLKTPLSIISGYAQNLIENIQTEKREYYAANICANVNRMDKIIREMLELSRIESDLLQIKYEDVSLREVCTKLLNRYSLECSDKHITMSLEGDAIIKADFSLMERVLDNFFVNALDYTPGGGTIIIRVFDNSLEFYNSGSRIPEDMIHEIWQPYKKADDSRSNTKGTGLGLSIASKMLELYNFSYGAKNVDDGVVFWFKW